MKKFLITEEEKKHILSLYSLVEDFKSQKKKFIDQGYDESIVDTYLNDFRQIKDKRFKEASNSDIHGLSVPKGNDRFNIDSYKTFQELEALVDYVSGQRNVGSKNFTDIVVDGKPIYENENVEIFFAPNRESCVKYKGDKPYSWCVSRKDSSNMYHRYRYSKTEPSFYFVKLKKRMNDEFKYWDESNEPFLGTFKDKYHFVVIQVTKNQEYILTSAHNDGEKKMSWDEITSILPELKNLEMYFKNVPVPPEEKSKVEIFSKGISDEEFSKLPYKDKELYIDSTTSLSYHKFKILPEDLKNKYIGLGIKLTKEQYDLIKDNPKLLKRLKDVFNEVFDNIYGNIDVKKVKKWDNERLYNKYQPYEYELLNEKNKNFFKLSSINDIEKKVTNLYNAIQEIESYGLSEKLIERLVSQIEKYKTTQPKKDPLFDIFYLKEFFDMEKLKTYCKNKYFMLYMSISAFLDSKEQMMDFFNYVDVDFDTFIRSLNKEELKVFELVKEKK